MVAALAQRLVAPAGMGHCPGIASTLMVNGSDQLPLPQLLVHFIFKVATPVQLLFQSIKHVGPFQVRTPAAAGARSHTKAYALGTVVLV